MSVTFDLKSVLVALVLIALIVLIVFAIILIGKLFKTINHANAIMDEVDKLSNNVSIAASDVSDAVKGNAKVITAASSVAQVAGMIKKVVDRDKN